ATLDATDVQVRFKILIGVITAVGTAGIMWLGAEQVLAGRLTVGGLLVFLSYLASLYAPLNTLAFSSSTVQAATGRARRVLELLATEHEVEERPDARTLATAHGDVCIDQVTVGYTDGVPVLHAVCLSVVAGETIAI